MSCDDEGWKLIQAVLADKPDVIAALLKDGIDVHARGYDRGTALHAAAMKGSIRIVELLIEAGADVNAVDEDLWTPLHYAANRGCVDVTQFLLARGAKVNAPTTNFNSTPLHMVAAWCGKEMADLLLKKRG